jgi:hypothetical protein
MDRLKVSLAATSAVFFWLPVALILMVTRLFGTMNYSFGLVFGISQGSCRQPDI